MTITTQLTERRIGSGYVSGLDGLRAVAALLVVCFHSNALGMSSGGLIGVEIFFVISGFLITGLLVDEYEAKKTIDVFGFHLRRLARLYPLLLTYLFAVMLASPWISRKFDVGAELLLGVGYLSNFSRSVLGEPLLLRHLWTLAVEMQFYLFWPFAFLLMKRYLPNRELAVSVIFLALAIAWRFVAKGDLADEYVLSTALPGRHVAAFATGSLVSILREILTKSKLGLFGIAGLVLLVAGTQVYEKFALRNEPVVMFFVDCAAALCIVAVLNSRGSLSRLLSNGVFSRLGLWSYGIYLWHYLFARFLRTELDGELTLLATLAVSVPLAAFTFHFIEQPLRIRLQRRARAWRNIA